MHMCMYICTYATYTISYDSPWNLIHVYVSHIQWPKSCGDHVIPGHVVYMLFILRMRMYVSHIQWPKPWPCGDHVIPGHVAHVCIPYPMAKVLWWSCDPWPCSIHSAHIYYLLTATLIYASILFPYCTCAAACHEQNNVPINRHQANLSLLHAHHTHH